MFTCIFCKIIASEAPCQLIYEWDDTIAIVPFNPVTNGHVLIIPKIHVVDFAVDPKVTSLTFKRAAEFAYNSNNDYNLITNKGKLATQSIFHLHIHVIPRRENDDLKLPWSKTK